MNITEIDAAIIAEEQGWDYVPACDEAYLLLAEIEQITVAAVSQPNNALKQDTFLGNDIVVNPFLDITTPNVNKSHLRARLIRDTMGCVREEEDDQSIAWHIINDDRWLPLLAGKDDEDVRDYVYGVIRFCERALRYNQ